MGPAAAGRLHRAAWDRVAYLARYARMPLLPSCGGMTTQQALWLEEAIGRLVERENKGTR